MTNADITPWLNAIHQGDILELLPELPDASVDLVVASPPYNLLNSTGNGSRCWDGYDGHSDDMPHHAYVEWQRLCLSQMLRVLKPDGAIFYNHMHRVQNGLIVRNDDILQDFPLRQVIIWHRSGGTNFNRHYFLPDYEVVYLITKPGFRLLDGHTDGSVWRIHQEQHSWIPEIPTFPVDLPRRAIRATSAKVVLDPFTGSGTTAVAAVLEGRSYIGIEQSARYCAIARERLAGLDPTNGTPSLPMPPRPLFDVSDLPCRGSSRSVFRYISDAVTNNGSMPKVIDQSGIAEHLQVDLRTVQRAVRSLKVCGAIEVTNHGQWSSYELKSPPRTVVTAHDNVSGNVATDTKKSPRTVVTTDDNPSRNVATDTKKSPRTVVTTDDNPSRNVATDTKKSPRTVVTTDDNPSRNVATDTKKSPRTVVTTDDNPSRNVATDTKKSPRTVVTTDDNPSRNVATDTKKSPRTVVITVLATLETAPGPGPGGIQDGDLDVQYGVNDPGPGPGPGEPRCPVHPGQHPFWFHKGDRVFWCKTACCSWIASQDLGDIIPPGKKPIRHHELAAAYYEKQYRPRKWARRYYGHQQRAA